MIAIRLAEEKDFDFFYRLKSVESNIFGTGHGRAPEREGLKSFFNDAVARQSQADARKIYIIILILQMRKLRPSEFRFSSGHTGGKWSLVSSSSWLAPGFRYPGNSTVFFT